MKAYAKRQDTTTMKQTEHQAQIVDIPKDPDHRDLWFELKLIKENHLKHLADKQEHLHQDVDDVKTELKETRTEFNQKIDRLDNRIWWLMGLVTVTMLGVITKVVLG